MALFWPFFCLPAVSPSFNSISLSSIGVSSGFQVLSLLVAPLLYRPWPLTMPVVFLLFSVSVVFPPLPIPMMFPSLSTLFKELFAGPSELDN